MAYALKNIKVNFICVCQLKSSVCSFHSFLQSIMNKRHIKHSNSKASFICINIIIYSDFASCIYRYQNNVLKLKIHKYKYFVLFCFILCFLIMSFLKSIEYSISIHISIYAIAICYICISILPQHKSTKQLYLSYSKFSKQTEIWNSSETRDKNIKQKHHAEIK